MASNALQPEHPIYIGAVAVRVEHNADAQSIKPTLLARIVAGDVAALDDSLRQLWAPLLTYIVGILGSRDEAEDIAQEAFIRLWDNRKKLDAGGSLAGFVYRAARNLAISRLRSARVSDRTALALSNDQDLTVSIELEDDALHGPLAEKLRELPPRRREILLLHVVHELSYKDIAAMLGIAPQTVANQCTTALASLRGSVRKDMMV